MKKTFVLCDDETNNLYVHRITRTDNQVIKALRDLEVGDIYQLKDPNANVDGLMKGVSTKYWIRES